jgi:hypothetical protein
MGKVASAATISSTAFLTETGRKYLFGKNEFGQSIRFNADGTDNFQVTQFALFDNDRNYKVSNNFATGEMPDVAGTSDNHCLKTSPTLSILNMIMLDGTIPQSFETDLQYVISDVVVDAYTSFV